jgi:crotonobetainyl-CoA:carnitine CoA-transferase CaiB-like acyl-CoA transferase
VDGPLIVATGNDRQSRDFCRIVGRPDLETDPRFARNPDRLRHRAEMVGALAEAVAVMRRADLLAALEAAHVPAGPIYTVAEAFADPQAITRGMRVDLPATGVRGGTAPSVRSPIMLDGEAFAAPFAAPRLGEHTLDVLTGIGLGETDIAALRARGVVG